MIPPLISVLTHRLREAGDRIVCRMTLYAAAGALALVAGGAAAQLGAMSEQVSMDQVPAAAKAAAMYAAGGTELTDVALDLDGGQATDEFTGKNADGRQVEIDVLPDGKVTEIEHEGQPGSGPAAGSRCGEAVPAGLPAAVHRAQHARRRARLDLL